MGGGACVPPKQSHNPPQGTENGYRDRKDPRTWRSTNPACYARPVDDTTLRWPWDRYRTTPSAHEPKGVPGGEGPTSLWTRHSGRKSCGWGLRTASHGEVDRSQSSGIGLSVDRR